MFIEIPATKISLSKRRPVSGVGINDAEYLVTSSNNGVHAMCPFYQIWKGILLRCYVTSKTKHPSYKGCYMCDEWLLFSNFKKWMETKDWKYKCLDKDILYQGNKEYSPEKCLFVSTEINTLLNNNKSRRGKYKVGVTKRKSSKKFYAQLSESGVSRSIGSFDTEHQAHKAYLKAKRDRVISVANQQVEPLRSALLNFNIEE